MIRKILPALVLAGSLTACGGGTTPHTQADLLQDAIAAMRDGDYTALVALCSPATRAEAMVGVLMAQAFDPDGAMLKASVAEGWSWEQAAADGEAPPVQVDGRWYLNCTD